MNAQNLRMFAHAVKRGLVFPSVCIYPARQSKEVTLAVSGVYGLVRHPAYTGLMITMWITPTMVHTQTRACMVYVTPDLQLGV